ncbi:hypothetical protein [Mycolicibacterium wolinskyi]|uniref:hypothetical protein n=1 Tax=Mycolicibacterium wolinskyi TaxID=59750 RepID=UPI0023AB0EBE
MTPPATGEALMTRQAVTTATAAVTATCFENCSPLRTRCPGPAARLSCDEDGCWTAVCRAR